MEAAQSTGAFFYYLSEFIVRLNGSSGEARPCDYNLTEHLKVFAKNGSVHIRS